MKAVAFLPGSCPPSPGFEPCAILISSCSARARYSAVTPKRAEATCLMAASRRSPSADGAYQAGSSPPSPEFALPPSRAMPMLIAWCASGDSAPRLIAELTKRRTIRDAGSTSRSGTAPSRPAAASAGRAAAAGRSSASRPRGMRRARRRVVDRRPGAPSPPSARRRASPRSRGSGRSPGPRGRAPRPRERAPVAGDQHLADLARAPTDPGQRFAAGKQRSTSPASRPIDVEDLPAAVRAQRAGPHPRQHLAQPLLQRGDRVASRLVRLQVLGAALAGLLGRQLQQQPRMDGRCADRDQHRDVVDVERVAGFDRRRRSASAGPPRRAPG